MLSLLAALTLTQASAAPASAPAHDVAVLMVVREGALPPELVVRLSGATRAALSQAQLEVQPESQTLTLLGNQDPIACQTNVTCFGLLGRTLDAAVLVRVEASAVETDLAVFVQAVDTRDLKVLGQQSLVTQTSSTREAIAAQLLPLARQIRVAVPPRARAEVTPPAKDPGVARKPDATTRGEAGQAPDRTADQDPSQAEVTATDTAETTRQLGGRPAWPLVPAGIGVAAAAVGGAFVMQARSDAALLMTPDPDAPKFTEQERREIAQRGSTSQMLGWSLVGAGAAALTAGLALYFAAEPADVASTQESDVDVTALVGPSGIAIGGTF